MCVRAMPPIFTCQWRFPLCRDRRGECPFDWLRYGLFQSSGTTHCSAVLLSPRRSLRGKKKLEVHLVYVTQALLHRYSLLLDRYLETLYMCLLLNALPYRENNAKSSITPLLPPLNSGVAS